MDIHVLCLINCMFIHGAFAVEKLYVDRPRGVPLSRKALYVSGSDFTCFDGSNTIPFKHVNDDYCDCADGSDEPGTPACPNGRFSCLNLGYRELNIPSSRVNDQLCDCCDGSDEFSDLVQCPNICDELGKQAAEEAEKWARINKEGFVKRQELVEAGRKLLADTRSRVEGLKNESEALDARRDEVDMKKQDVERAESQAKDKHLEAWKLVKAEKLRIEAIAAFADLDTNKDDRISLIEIISRTEFDSNLDGQVSEQEAKDHLGDREESDLRHFVDELWTNLKNSYRKPPFINEEPPENVAYYETTEIPDTLENVDGQTEVLDEKDEKEGDEEEIEGDEVDDFDAEKYTKEGESQEAKIDPDGDELPAYDDDTQKLIDEAEQVRKEYSKVDGEFKEIDSQIKASESFLNMDLGVDSEWASLRNQCFELTDSSYIYKLCMFDRATQKDKNGGGEISLGNWIKWDESENEKYTRQKYENGQSCWNGPDRFTEVWFRCGIETKLVETSEPGRCEYRFMMDTPAICRDPSKVHEKHAEL